MFFDYQNNVQFFAQNHVILFKAQLELVWKTETEKKVKLLEVIALKIRGILLPLGVKKNIQ